MRHLIKKQIIELSLQAGSNHFHVQQQVSERYWNEMVPMLEKAFDAISTDDEVVEIDRFELDLGIVSEKEIEKPGWANDIRKKIEEEIAAITDPSSAKYAIKSRDRRLNVFGQWLYYMDHGYLPWNTSKSDDRWYQDVLEAIAVDVDSHHSLQNKIKGQSFFLQRIVSQHPRFFLHKLTEIMTARKQGGLPVAIDELLFLYRFLAKRKKIKGELSDKAFTNGSWSWLLQTAAGTESLSPGQTLAEALTENFVQEYAVSMKIPTAVQEKIPFVLPSLLRSAGEWKSSLEKEKNKITGLVETVNSRPIPKRAQEKEHTAGEPEVSKYNGRMIDGDGLFIVNAGIVLLHPFLKSLFGRLELLTASSFLNKEKQQYAVGLIHYLATGETKAEEYELALPKILCAFSLEEPMEMAETYPDTYLREADDLLIAAIAQWSILNNTTANGLREGFLQRAGKLYSKNGNLYLQVEKKSIDVILDYLPWSLGMIKLPWMKDILRVEWR